MENRSKQSNKECMKAAMLKQEEIFRHQVHELHRLYRLQMHLMREMKNAEMHRQRSAQSNLESWNTEDKLASNQPCISYLDQRQDCPTLNLEFADEKSIEKKSTKSISEETDDENHLELTLCTGTSHRRLLTQKAKEASSDSGSNFSSSSTESATAKSKNNEWGVIQMPVDMSMKFIDQSKNNLVADERTRQDGLKHPPWLFQCLSLNIAS